MQRIILELTI